MFGKQLVLQPFTSAVGPALMERMAQKLRKGIGESPSILSDANPNFL